MGWIKRVPKAHWCSWKPSRPKTFGREWDVGSEWQCRKCNTIWVVKKIDTFDGEYIWERKNG